MDFKKTSRAVIKARILKNNILPYECSICGISEWQGKELSLPLDHIDGNNENNHLSNLRLLCPNCHSQTDTYCGRNNKSKYGTKNQKVSDIVLIDAMRNNTNPATALRSVGLAGAGNYKRVYRLAEKHNIKHMKQKVRKNIHYSLTCQNCLKIFHVTTERESKQKFCSRGCVKKPISNERMVDALKECNGNYSAAGRLLGMSDNGIRKRLG